MTTAKRLTLFLIIALMAPALSYAKIVDKIVAVVNDEVITQAEVDRLLYPFYIDYEKKCKSNEELYSRLDDARRNILKQLVEDRVILAEAKRQNIAVDESEVDEQIDRVKKELADKGAKFDDLLRDQNITVNDLRRRYRERLMIQKAVDNEVRSSVDIQPSEVCKYYNSHIDGYTEPESAGVLAIFIKRENERTPEESRKLAEDVLKLLADGADFKAIARNYSEGPERDKGGDMGYVKRGDLVKEADEAVFALEPGDMSDIIFMPSGYYIFKLYGRKKKKTVPLEEVRQKITEALYQKKARDRFEKWIDKLKANAYISIK